ncbi:hypothetical protein FKP32DRAFT_1594935 [Trametes sanguinea]|nr:hypothetical protein FKP32DRAFT_1594935 [Trametes sanguinea]
MHGMYAGHDRQNEDIPHPPLESPTYVGPLPDVSASREPEAHQDSVWTSRLRVRKSQAPPVTNVFREEKKTPGPRVKEAKKKVKQKRTVQQVRAVKKSRTKQPRTVVASPIKNTRVGCRTQWTCVRSRRGPEPTSGLATAMLLSALQKPRIWAATLGELRQAIPELSRVQNGIVFETTQTPVIFLDGETGSECTWEGGKVIELSMTRRFNHSVPNVPLGPYNSAQRDAQGCPPEDITSTYEPFPAPDPLSQVIQQADGLYYYTDIASAPAVEVREEPLDGALHGSSQAANISTTNGLRSTSLASLAPDDDPPEIKAILHAHTAGLPVSIILCSNTVLAPLMPDGCGCAFLGFFMIKDVQTQTEDVEWGTLPGEAECVSIHGIKTWKFSFAWAPGGELLDGTAPNTTPWWMPSTTPSDIGPISDVDAPSPLLQYTLLPLQYLAPPTLNVCADADVKLGPGWHCENCGRINVQRNLCVQSCASCSTPNGVTPISVEYVRQARGTDPVSIPWDRYTEAVRGYSGDGADGLRRFTYVLNDAAFVHHMFTRNRAEAQITAEPSAKGKLGSRVGPYYHSQFSTAPFAVYGPEDDPWPAIAPSSICQARELMLRRAQGAAATPPAIDCLTICAWRTTGHKKGTLFVAGDSPVVMLCLGADVEISFSQPKAPETVPASTTTVPLPPWRTSLQPTTGVSALDDEVEMVLVDELEEDDEAFAYLSAFPDDDPLSAAQDRPSAGPDRQARERSSEEVLMLTLVHGDVMVVHGSALEYSIKRTGMSMLLVGSQQ